MTKRRAARTILAMMSCLAPGAAQAIPVSFGVNIGIDFYDENETPGAAFNNALDAASLGALGTVHFAFDTDDLVPLATDAYHVAAGRLSATVTLAGVSQTESGSTDGDPWQIQLGDGVNDTLSIGFAESSSGIGARFLLADPSGTAFDLSAPIPPGTLFGNIDFSKFTSGSWFSDSECCTAASGTVLQTAVPEPTAALGFAIALAVSGAGLRGLRR